MHAAHVSNILWAYHTSVVVIELSLAFTIVCVHDLIVPLQLVYTAMSIFKMVVGNQNIAFI